MRDFEAFQDALDADGDGEGSTYVGNLTRSMSLALDSFYSDLRCCGVSSHTGEVFFLFCVVFLDSHLSLAYSMVDRGNKVLRLPTFC